MLPFGKSLIPEETRCSFGRCTITIAITITTTITIILIMFLIMFPSCINPMYYIILLIHLVAVPNLSDITLGYIEIGTFWPDNVNRSFEARKGSERTKFIKILKF